MSTASLSENGQKVFDARYAGRDNEGNIVETFEQAVYRLARTAASAEKEGQSQWEKKFALAIGELLFVPSTPIWANMGKPDMAWQPGACFVLALEDSLNSMYETLTNTAMIFKSGGGTGYNFSTIRPRGDLVRSTKGQASGVVELIKLYNASANMVMQGGVRRGASMGILNIDHPEIKSFIQSKLEGDLTNFNLSVGVTKAFMEALENNADWSLQFNNKIYEVLPAAQLWDMLIEAAYACGDPGVIFVDRLQEHNPVPYKAIDATNPCVTGDTWVTTAKGARQVKDLLGRQFTVVVNGQPHPTGDEGFSKTGTRPVVRLETHEGYSLRLTPDHKILKIAKKTRYRISSQWVPAADLQPGDLISLHNHKEITPWEGELSREEGYLLGLLVGDGTLKSNEAVLSVWPREMAANYTEFKDGTCQVMHQALACAATLPHRSDFTGWVAVKGRNEFRLKMAGLKQLAWQMGMSKGHKTITPAIEQASFAGYCGFLQGLFDADGTVIGSQKKGVSVRLPQSNLPLLQAAQRMLLRLGIVSCIYMNRRTEGTHRLPDSQGNPREYKIKAQHELVISNDNILTFREHIGFNDSYKSARLDSLIGAYTRLPNRERYTARVKVIVPDGTADVFDVQVPGVNAFDANGIYTHNCGEQPLHPGESCLLGSINLARMMTTEGEVKWDLLEETVYTASRFLDNLIDVAEYPLPLVAQNTRATRKVGLGYTGLHDALIKAWLPYDSDEGRHFAGNIAQRIQSSAWESARLLGEEKGVFPDWEQSIFHSSGDKRRNAANTTIAPTGSVTAMAGCEGYGIEPIFAIAYTKATNVAGSFEVFSPLFLEACRQRNIPAPILTEVAARGTCQEAEGIPEDIARVFKGAQDIGFEDHILMQAVIQKYTDNAVSKTINLPNSATTEDIEKCYRMAYQLGLKGNTIFRDGSKEGTITVGEKKKSAEDHGLRRGEILPRPESAMGVTHRLSSGCGKIYLTVNYRPDNGEILETFITTGSDGGCLVYTEATSRLVSLCIRGGINVDKVVEQLQSTHSCPAYLMARGKGKTLSPGKSCASAIAKKLAEIIEQLATNCNGDSLLPALHTLNTEDCSVQQCEFCGLQMHRAEGCLVCTNCGYSKC